MRKSNEFSEYSVDPDPFEQFSLWYSEHLAAGIVNPDSVFLGTASPEGKVSIRTVLLKDYDDEGFVFFTNYNSRKGVQISQNPSAALLFYWCESGRQVRIEGKISKTSEYESVKYFNSRPRESQIGAWASEQSSIIPDRSYLENRYREFESRFRDQPVQKPFHWGGFRLLPDMFEFWQEGPYRLHDRILYTRINDTWRTDRLAP